MYERNLPECLANDLALYWKADGPHVTAQGAKGATRFLCRGNSLRRARSGMFGAAARPRTGRERRIAYRRLRRSRRVGLEPLARPSRPDRRSLWVSPLRPTRKPPSRRTKTFPIHLPSMSPSKGGTAFGYDIHLPSMPASNCGIAVGYDARLPCASLCDEQTCRAPFRGVCSRACSCRPQAGSCAVALPKADRPRCQNDARRRSKAFKPARLSGIANGATRRTARRLAFVVARQRIYIYCNICTIWKCQQFTASLHKSLAAPKNLSFKKVLFKFE